MSRVIIAVFSTSTYITGLTVKDFRFEFLNDFRYISGFQFCAKEFGCSSQWGVHFAIWDSQYTPLDERESFAFDVCNIRDKQVKIETVHSIYNLDVLESAKDWVKEPIKNMKTFDAPVLTSALKIKENAEGCSLIENAIGYLEANANYLGKGQQATVLLTSCYSTPHGSSINADNIDRCCAYFTARRVFNLSWVTAKDECIAPSAEKQQESAWKEYCNDSIIFSTFNQKSHQSSLRKVKYHGKVWDIKNEFFWMSRNDMISLAYKYRNCACLQDAYQSKERYVYNYLQDARLSKPARNVLEMAQWLTELSFCKREEFDKMHPEYQINNWDCGYYQLKALWKQFYPQLFDEFIALINELREKLKPQALHFFLKK